jgi:hypothetical protein
MRTLFAILGLLFCLIATRADELPVIKDSEAVQYIVKTSKYGVYNQSTRDYVYQFWDENILYHTFDGFIAAGSKMTTGSPSGLPASNSIASGMTEL